MSRVFYLIEIIIYIPKMNRMIAVRDFIVISLLLRKEESSISFIPKR